MASIQLTNRLTATDKNIPTPVPFDPPGTTTRAKDYLLEVELVNQPISIELFKDLNTDFDPYVQVFQVPKGSRGANVADTGLLVAQDDDSGSGNSILDSKIPGVETQYFNGASDPLRSVPGVDYVVRRD
ncbi:MAG TPA: hypothetical protein V6D31_08645 [Candidatus Sericytochromatia bacterium]